MNAVTPEHAKQFSKFVAHWREFFCLGDWRIAVSATRTKRKGVMAEVSKVDLEQRMAVIKLASEWLVPVTDTELNLLALHEVAHIFLHELIEAAKVPDQSVDTIRSAEHRVINVLEQRILPGEP